MSGSADRPSATGGRRPVVAVVRHAQPEGREGPRRFLGQSDAPLGAVGVQQARELAERLAPLAFEAVYCSDLRRSLVTAQIVAERAGLSMVAEPRLREVDIGLWDGLTEEEARQRFPAEYAAREADLVGYAFPDGESFRALERRVMAAFHDIRRQGGQRIVIVAHLGVNRVLLCNLRGLPLESLFSIRQDYCGVEIVELDAGTGIS